MGAKHRVRPNRLWAFVLGTLLVILLTIGVAGYATSPSSGGFGGSTVIAPPRTSTSTLVFVPAPVATAAATGHSHTATTTTTTHHTATTTTHHTATTTTTTGR